MYVGVHWFQTWSYCAARAAMFDALAPRPDKEKVIFAPN
jgi:hypothetical protein